MLMNIIELRKIEGVALSVQFIAEVCPAKRNPALKSNLMIFYDKWLKRSAYSFPYSSRDEDLIDSVNMSSD